MRQILLSVVFVLSGVAQINAHHTDRESFGVHYSGPNVVSEYFEDNPREWRKSCRTKDIIRLLRNIANGVPPEVSLRLFEHSFKNPLVISAERAHGLIYAFFLDQWHIRRGYNSDFLNETYQELKRAGRSNFSLTKTEMDMNNTTNIVCGILWPEVK